MAKTLLTLEEFLALEDQKPALEYMCGEALPKPMPDRPHSRLQVFLVTALVHFLATTPLGEAFTELRCIFGPPGRRRVFVPDVCFVETGRITESSRFQNSAPDLAVEILSPEQNMARLIDKFQFYLLHGVRMVWVVDPVQRTVASLEPGHEVFAPTEGDTLSGGSVLPGLEVPVSELFAKLGGAKGTTDLA